jgi:hypothetical protein
MIRKTLLLAAIATLLAACGATAPEKKSVASKLSPEEAVALRAKERWDLIIAKEHRKAYEYLSPGTRVTTPVDAYVRRLLGTQVRWFDASVETVICEEPDVCKARVKLSYKVRTPMMGISEMEASSPVTESWLLSDGQWYHLPDKTGR